MGGDSQLQKLVHRSPLSSESGGTEKISFWVAEISDAVRVQRLCRRDSIELFTEQRDLALLVDKSPCEPGAQGTVGCQFRS